MTRVVRVASGLALLSLALSGCGAGSSGAADLATPGTDPTEVRQPATESPLEPVTVTVLAAASLTEAFTTIATEFEQLHPHVTVTLSFGSSTTLAQQIAGGADADLYASAGRGALDQLPADYAVDGGEEDIASNVLQIAVQPGNPAGITGLEDFTRTDLDTVLCADTVPCGRAADEAFAKAGLSPTPVSREIDVKATLAKISLKEADAAIVYRSDVVTNDSVDGIEIPADVNVSMAYPLVWFNTDAATVSLADFITGDAGQAALQNAGFSTP